MWPPTEYVFKNACDATPGLQGSNVSCSSDAAVSKEQEEEEEEEEEEEPLPPSAGRNQSKGAHLVYIS